MKRRLQSCRRENRHSNDPSKLQTNYAGSSPPSLTTTIRGTLRLWHPVRLVVALLPPFVTMLTLRQTGHRLVHPDLQRLILLDLIHQFRPDLSISSFSYSVGDPLVSSKTTRFLAFPCESDREDGFRLMAVQGDSIIGMNGDLVCVKKEAARTAKGESKSGLARMVRWE